MLQTPGQEPNPNPDEIIMYQIRVKGLLGSKWSDWFDDFTITAIDNDSLLTGPVPDQAALHGVLGRIRDLGLTLVFISRLETKKHPAKSERTL